MQKKLAHYFATYSNDECFSTSDGFIFHREHDATAHGNTLSDKNVETHYREDYPAGKEVALTPDTEEAARSAAEAKAKADADKKAQKEAEKLAKQQFEADKKAEKEKEAAEKQAQKDAEKAKKDAERIAKLQEKQLGSDESGK